ncbi:MAG: hypothetical protein HOH33_01775 [Verrucomicrobia bacterium]|nr:hypothetical protein [Verrucomicrobiota bacterium]
MRARSQLVDKMGHTLTSTDEQQLFLTDGAIEGLISLRESKVNRGPDKAYGQKTNYS